MNNRQFLNLVVETYRTGMLSLRRIKVANNLFYPSTAAAEAAMARSEAAIRANAKRQAGYKHGFRSLRARATKLGALPSARINFQSSGPAIGGDLCLEFVALLGDESMILCGDSSGATSLYDADSHSVMTLHGLRASKGQDAIPISVTRAANGYARPYNSLFVMNRTLDSEKAEYMTEELSYGGDGYLSSDYPLINRWRSLPPPRFIYRSDYEDPANIGGHAVVGSTIYVSSGIGTYSFDTLKWMWRRAGEWKLPFYGRAEFVPELNLWEHPPCNTRGWTLTCPRTGKPWSSTLSTWALAGFASSRLKTFLGTRPPLEVGFSDDEDDGDEIDLTDAIDWEFAVLTGIEVVRSGDGVRMIKHKSRFFMLADHAIKWVL
ncbi:unnamed protein product [Urochloa decumbens]|uniref:Uncharacterized protein n=1 Tax=Urochloa decumbens TaxID=240449 RepID=A0ABC8XN01_9POAL